MRREVQRHGAPEAPPAAPAPAVPDPLATEIDRLAEETRRRCPDVWAELARLGRVDTLS